ncbi:MAG: ribosome small subunit-dependent GTPase A [Bacteroidales bacterium]|nr:ribosome small subunit-dependent GTPase A [Bacteroidales bacterium]
MGNGTVIKNTGSSYLVTTPDGTTINCKVKGNFRLKGIRTTNPVAVGDEVTFTANADDTAYITAIAPRRNYIIRRASNLSKEAHILAANVDQAFLVVSLKEPITSTTFIDRFLATAEAYSVPVTIIINKTDLLDAEERELAEAVRHLYTTIGYEVMLISATEDSGEAIASIKAMAQDKTSLISGNSGVGKSTLINRLIPSHNLRTARVSATHHTGMHTTTFSEMHPLPGGGYLIDTPGVKGFGTVDFGNDVAHYFREIFACSSHCKYGNCTHTHEPGCAVRDAVESHEISESRYTSYLSILEDKEEGKYRKPF